VSDADQQKSVKHLCDLILNQGNAVAVLTDVEKRKHYDQFGPEDERLSARSYTNNYREFDADTTDEFFNMFFGGGFNGANVYVRRGGRWQRQNTGSQETHHTHHHREVSPQIVQVSI
jgi:DnaJ-class molecular chaperone